MLIAQDSNMTILKDEITIDPNGVGYSGMSNIEVADALNAKNIPSLKVIETHDIEQYLVLSDLLLEIEDSTSEAARLTVRALDKFPSFNVPDPQVLGKLTSILTGLVGDSSLAFSEADKTNILSLGNTSISRASQLGLGIVTTGQVQAERN